MFYALRYQPQIQLKDRKHGATEGRFDTWLDAELERERLPSGRLLEVVQRDGEGGGVG